MFRQSNHTCFKTVEALYYSVGYPDCCCHCGCKCHLIKATNEYTMCRPCKQKNKAPVMKHKRKAIDVLKYFVNFLFAFSFFFSLYIYVLDGQFYSIEQSKDSASCSGIREIQNLNIIISLSCHEQVCLSGLRFERYFSHHRAR